jgi:hypothetical protein
MIDMTGVMHCCADEKGLTMHKDLGRGWGGVMDCNAKKLNAHNRGSEGMRQAGRNSCVSLRHDGV